MTVVHAVTRKTLVSCGVERCVLPALVGIADFRGVPTVRRLLVSEKWAGLTRVRAEARRGWLPEQRFGGEHACHRRDILPECDAPVNQFLLRRVNDARRADRIEEALGGAGLHHAASVGDSTSTWTFPPTSPTIPTITSRRPDRTRRSSAPRSSRWSNHTSATSTRTTGGTRTTTTTRGAMAFPWMWAGRRWVAPVPYQKVRYPADSSIAQPLEAGKYISTYWITDGQYEHHLRWAVGTNHRLFADERVYLERDHTFTSFQRYRGPIYRDADGPARHPHARLPVRRPRRRGDRCSRCGRA